MASEYFEAGHLTGLSVGPFYILLLKHLPKSSLYNRQPHGIPQQVTRHTVTFQHRNLLGKNGRFKAPQRLELAHRNMASFIKRAMETGFDPLHESEVHYGEILTMPREIPPLKTLWKARLPLPEAFSDL